ncbi:MAG TPA: SpoIIE family protein phosphatase [Spirochaetota bacterium]|nr:SpoIIE family protein phosphatase [Spirochaetota bacterium]
MLTISLVSSLVASILLPFMALFVMYKDWRDQVHRFYSLLILSGFGIVFTMFITYAFQDSTALTEINRITQAATAFTFTSLFGVSLVFPKGESRFPFKYSVLIFLPTIVVSVIVNVTDWSITAAYFKGGVLIRDFNFFYTYYALIVLVYLILGTGNFIIKYIRTKIRIFRLQMRFVFLGTSFGIMGGAVCSIILPRFFNYSELYVLGPSLASFIAFGSLFYSIISYNVMDITTAVHKTATYTIISMGIFVPIFLVLGAWDTNLWSAGEAPLFVVAGVVAAIFILFSVYVQPAIDQAFKRRQYEFEAIIDRFIRDVGGLRDFTTIIRRSVDILHDSLFLKSAFFILFDNESKRYELAYQKGAQVEVPPLERGSPVIRWFIRNQEVLSDDRVYTDEKSFADIKEDFLGFFSAGGTRIVIPIYHERRVLGLLCLGDKDSLAAYKPDEIEKLDYFRSESNTHISNALIYEESKQQQLIGRTMDLSSDILAKAVPLKLPNLIGIKFGAFLVPRYGEGIDYFDFIRPGSHGVGVVATDIAGVGINSALYSVVLRSAFQSCLEEAPSAYSVIQKMNNAVYEYGSGESGLITAYYLYYDLRSMRLIYSNAGFPPLDLYRIDKNDFDELDTEGIPLGYDPKASYGMGRTNLLRGDIGIVYSKALVTSKNQKGEAFGIGNLRTVIKEHRAERPEDIASAVKDRFLSFLGLASPESDIVAILFKIL